MASARTAMGWDTNRTLYSLAEARIRAGSAVEAGFASRAVGRDLFD